MADGPRHKVVVAAMIERGGKILAHRRPEGGWGAGMWEFPGGKVEEHEDPREALRRECREELGVEVEAGKVFDVASHRYDDGSVLLLFIWARILEGDPKPLTGGELLWADTKAAAELPWLPADVPIVQAWRASTFRRR